MVDASDASFEHVRDAVLPALRRLSIMRVGNCLFTSAAAIAAMAALSGRLALTVAAGSAGLAGVYAVGAYRSMKARWVVAREPGVQVRFEGWCRPPDGCNYALFDPDPASDVPFAVLRLPIVRDMSTGRGWLFWGSGVAAALVSVNGDLLGAGRVVDDGMSRWHRRVEPIPRFVKRPPPNFKPPAG